MKATCIIRAVIVAAVIAVAVMIKSVAAADPPPIVRGHKLPELLRTARQAFARQAVESRFRFKRVDSGWYVDALDVWGNPLADLDHLATFSDVTDLGLNQFGKKHALKGWEVLSSLPRLQRFETNCANAPEDVNAISKAPCLKSLTLSRDTHVWELDKPKPNEEAQGAFLLGLRQMRDLRTLHLLGGDLTDEALAAIEPLSKLTDIDLSYNTITQAGLGHLRRLPDLRTLKLDDIDGEGMSVIANLPHLEELDVRMIRPSDGKQELSSLKRLAVLRVLNGIAGDKGETIQLPANLTRLEIPYDAARRLNLQSAPNLKQVGIRLRPPAIFAAEDSHTDNEGNPIDLTFLTRLPRLADLSVAYPRDQEFKQIAEIRGLRGLTVKGDRTLVSDKALNALKGLSQLESLSVTDGALIAGAHLESLGTLTNLRRLAFQYYPYDTAPTGHKELAKLRQLRELDLELSGQGVAKFSDSILEVIATLDGLEELGIHCVISDAGLHALKALKKLKSLDLTKCSGYTDRGLATLVESLPGLQIIRFSMNQAPMGDQRKR